MQEDNALRVRRAGFRATKARLALLTLLKKSRYPMSIQEIARKLHRSIDGVTVYRILDAFKRVGLIRQVDLRQGRPLYEIAHGTQHEHHHVVCTKCERIEDFDACNYQEVVAGALKQVRGFAIINSHSLELFGLCKKCTL